MTNPFASAPFLPFVDRTSGAKKLIFMLMWWLQFNPPFDLNIISINPSNLGIV